MRLIHCLLLLLQVNLLMPVGRLTSSFKPLLQQFVSKKAIVESSSNAWKSIGKLLHFGQLTLANSIDTQLMLQDSINRAASGMQVLAMYLEALKFKQDASLIQFKNLNANECINHLTPFLLAVLKCAGKEESKPIILKKIKDLNLDKNNSELLNRLILVFPSQATEEIVLEKLKNLSDDCFENYLNLLPRLDKEVVQDLIRSKMNLRDDLCFWKYGLDSRLANITDQNTEFLIIETLITDLDLTKVDKSFWVYGLSNLFKRSACKKKIEALLFKKLDDLDFAKLTPDFCEHGLRAILGQFADRKKIESLILGKFKELNQKNSRAFCEYGLKVCLQEISDKKQVDLLVKDLFKSQEGLSTVLQGIFKLARSDSARILKLLFNLPKSLSLQHLHNCGEFPLIPLYEDKFNLELVKNVLLFASQEERENRIVFFHGDHHRKQLARDFFKLLYERVHKSKLSKNFMFLRFDNLFEKNLLLQSDKFL